MTNAQAQNVNDQEVARMRMDQAGAKRAEAKSQVEWDRAQMVWEAMAKDWQETVRVGAETVWN